eukprot:4700597-Lingulodinium_polyedra.AAC.1
MEPAPRRADPAHDAGAAGGGRGRRGVSIPVRGPVLALQPRGRLAPAHAGRHLPPDPDFPAAASAHPLAPHQPSGHQLPRRGGHECYR